MTFASLDHQNIPERDLVENARPEVLSVRPDRPSDPPQWIRLEVPLDMTELEMEADKPEQSLLFGSTPAISSVAHQSPSEMTEADGPTDETLVRLEQRPPEEVAQEFSAPYKPEPNGLGTSEPQNPIEPEIPDPDLEEAEQILKQGFWLQGFWPRYNLERVIPDASEPVNPMPRESRWLEELWAADPSAQVIRDPEPVKPVVKEGTWLAGVEHEYGSYAAFDLKWDHHPLATDYHVDVVERAQTSGQVNHEVVVVQERLADPANPISEAASGTTAVVIGRYPSSTQAEVVQADLNTVRSGVFDLFKRDESDPMVRSRANALMVTTAYSIAAANGEVEPGSRWDRFFPFPDQAFDERLPPHAILADIEAALRPDVTVQTPDASLSIGSVQNGPDFDL